MRRVALAGIVLAAVAFTGACSDDPNSVAAQANAGDGKGYVAGDGTVEQISPTDRNTKIRVQGKTLEGKAIDSSSYLGKVVVLNKWGSWCPPCNAEAPGLEKTSQDLAAEDVQFLGVDIRESAATGLAFQRRMKISYPSLAWDGGGILLQMKGKANATPTTLVLDREGRLAGRISGEVTGSVLRDMVQDVLDEQPA